MNLFVGGLPRHTSEIEIKSLFKQLQVLEINAHVSHIQNTFAFLKVPAEEVLLAREKYHGLQIGEKFLHVSGLISQLQGCKRCLEFGHSEDTCSYQQESPVPASISSSRISVNGSLQTDQQEAPIVIDLLDSQETRAPQKQTPPIQQTENRSSSDQVEKSALAGILFAKTWYSENSSDEVSGGQVKREVQVQVPVSTEDVSTPAPSEEVKLPLKRRRGRKQSEEEPEEKKPARMKLPNPEKEMIQELQEQGVTTFHSSQFKLESSAAVVVPSSKVTCSTCKAKLMIKSVVGHVVSKTHKKASK